MTLELVLVLAGIFVLLVLSAFFSGSETALTAASRARMHALKQRGNRRARLVGRLTDRPERLLGAILLGNNLVNILASALATSLFLSLFGQAGVAYATLAMTLLVVVFAEVLPKTYAITAPERTALRAAPILRGVVWLFAPFVGAVQVLVRGMLRAFGLDVGEQAGPEAAEEEIRGTISLYHHAGAVARSDRDMLGGILDLRELEVVDVMVHRTQMQSLSADDPSERLVEEALKSPYTRLPVWSGEPENIIGILHAKDLLRALSDLDWDVDALDVRTLCAEPWFVPDTTSLQDQLGTFLTRKAHFALVVDEYGEVMGLVTLEDILEEIVGQIADEHDILDARIRPQPDGSVNVDGTVPIRDLNRDLDWDLPEDEATTIAGLVIHEAQAIPDPGQAFYFHGFRFEVLRKTRNKITALRIVPADKG